MYEEGNKHLSSNFGSLAIKIVILAVIVFLAGWIFIKITGTTSNGSSNTMASSNADYITNITAMKTAAFEYFTAATLPEKVGGTVKLTLTEMLNQKLLIDFTNDGETCDNDASYVQATKTADGNYALKVSLTCGDQSDFIVTTIENSSNSSQTNNTTSTDIVVDDSSSSSNTTNNSSTNSSNSSKNNSSSSSTNNSSSSSSSSSSNTSGYTSSARATTTTTTVTTTVNIKITCSSACCSTNCNNVNNNINNNTNNNTNINNNNNNNTDKEPDTDKTTTTRYYKYVKWSDWEDGYSTSSNAENKKVTEEYNTYCKKDEETYYTTSYVMDGTTKNKSYSYEVQFTKLPSNISDLTISNASYFSSSTTDYSAYINNRDKVYMTNNKDSANSYMSSASAFRSSSLKKSNFTFTVSNAYYSGGLYRTLVTIFYKNNTGVTPYYDSNLGYNVYYVPVKFDIAYTNLNDCVTDLASNSSKYGDYEITESTTKTVWMHRTATYKWSTATSLSGYEYTGEYEDRTN